MSVSYFFFYLTFGIVVPSLGPALLHLGYDKQHVGLIIAATYSFNALFPILGGRLTDKYFSLAQTIRIGAVAMALTSLGVWHYSERRSWLFIAFLLANAAMRSPINSLQDALAMQTARDQPGAYGRMRMVGSLGFALGSAGFGYLVDRHGIDIFFGAMVVVMTAFAGATLVLPSGKHVPQAGPAMGFWRGLERDWWLWLLAMLLHWVAFGPYHYGFTMLLLEQGVPQRLTGWYWSLAVGAEICMFYSSSYFFARWRVHTLLLGAVIANLVRWLMVLCFPHPLTLLAAQLIHAFGFGLFYAASMSAISGFSGGHNRASYQGLYSASVGGLGSIIGMSLAGSLHQHMPMSQVFGWMVPIQLAALMLLVRFPLTRTDRKTAPVIENQPPIFETKSD